MPLHPHTPPIHGGPISNRILLLLLAALLAGQIALITLLILRDASPVHGGAIRDNNCWSDYNSNPKLHPPLHGLPCERLPINIARKV